MSGAFVTAAVLVVLFPGVLALKIIEGMTEVKRRSEFDKIATAVGFSLAIYFAYLGISFWWGLPHFPVRYNPDGIWPVYVNGWGVLAVFLLTLTLAYLGGILLDRQFFARINWGFWLTSKTIGGPESAWLQAFSENADKYVRVHMKDGTVIQGAIDYYSDDVSVPEVFLGSKYVNIGNKAETVWIKKPGKDIQFVGRSGILITKDSTISYIVFLDGTDSEEYNEEL